MQFPSRDLTNQYISSSYDDVVQQYVPTGSNLYLLDGYGNVILGIPSASYGNTIITTSDTASYAVSASWAPGQPSSVAISASWASSSLSSSHANISTLALISDVALLADTASVAAFADTASTSTSSSFSTTASYAVNAHHVDNNGLAIPPYDYSNVTYNGPLGQVDECVYKQGGVSGVTVCIVTLLYSGSIFTGVSKSLG